MNKLFLVLALLVAGIFAQAQDKKNIKTKVLVAGNDGAALMAAIQASTSGVHTTLLTDEKEFLVEPSPLAVRSAAEQAMLDLIYKSPKENGAYVLQLFKVDDKGADVAATAEDKTGVPLHVVIAPVKKDDESTMKVVTNTGWSKFERSGSGWYVKLDDGRTIRADVLVYAARKNLGEKVLYSRSAVFESLSYDNNNYRMSIAAGIKDGKPAVASLFGLMKAGEENVIMANADDGGIAIGQAAGAAAAYAAFFDVKTSAVNVKMVQGELLKYKARLMPLTDVSSTDINKMALQKMALTGILKADVKEDIAAFEPDKPVTYADINQPMRDFYYKAQIWMEDNANKPVTLARTIDLVSYVGNKAPATVTQELQRGWQKTFGYPFDLEKVLTRKEFTIVVMDYLNPFNVAFDKEGKVIR